MSVSVILPTYNGGRYIRDSIDSCLAQTYTDIEVIIVDGGSQDGTLDIVKSYRDPRIQLMLQPANSGRLPGAINLGLTRAVGDYLTWTSDDNLYTPDAIDALVAFLEQHREMDFVYSDYWRTDENLRPLSHVIAKPPDNWMMAAHCGPCFLFRRHIYDTTGGEDTSVPLAADYEFWLRVWKKGYGMGYLNIPLYFYRLQPNSLTSLEGGERFMKDADIAMSRWIGDNPYRFPSRYARLVGDHYMSMAFENYRNGLFSRVLPNILRGLHYDPRYWCNRGVLSLLLESVIGMRWMRRVRKVSRFMRNAD
jgi:glycosyltransferase involved in cell wall biosynthesis